MITATNKITGEVIELPASSLAEIVEAWRVAGEYMKTAATLRDNLKKIVPKYVNDKGLSPEVDGAMFRVNTIQRYNYDKSVMRNVMDQDLFDTMLKPDKPAIDSFLKENLPDWSTELRNNMVAEGNPYEVIKLEKLSR